MAWGAQGQQQPPKIVVNRAVFGGASSPRSLPPEGVTRFQQIQNAHTVSGLLSKTEGSASICADGDKPIGMLDNVLTGSEPSAYFPFCAEMFGGEVFVGGGVGGQAWAARASTADPSLPGPWTQDDTLTFATADAEAILCFGEYAGYLLAAGVEGSNNTVRLFRFDPGTSVWALYTGSVLFPASTLGGPSYCWQLIPFGNYLYAMTDKGIWRLAGDPGAVGGLTSEQIVQGGIAGGSVTAVGDVLWAIANDATNSFGAVVKLSLDGTLSYRAAMAAGSQIFGAGVGPSYAPQSVAWYVDSLFWRKDGGGVFRINPVTEVEPTTAYTTTVTGLRAHRNLLFASRAGSDTVFTAFAEPTANAQWQTRTSFDYGAPMLSTQDALYQFEGDTVDLEWQYVAPPVPLALTLETDSQARLAAWCWDSGDSRLRIVRQTSASTWQLANQFTGLTPDYPAVSLVRYQSSNIVASNIAPLLEEFNGAYAAVTVPSDPNYAAAQALLPGLFLGRVPRPRYLATIGRVLAAANFADDTLESDYTPLERPMLVRLCEPANSSLFANLNVTYGDAQLWTTLNARVITGSTANEITGLFSFRGDLYVTTQNEVFVMLIAATSTADGSVALTGVSKVTGDYGCTAHNSIVQANNLVYWWSEIGPVVFDGQFVRPLRGTEAARDQLLSAQLGTAYPGLSEQKMAHGAYFAQNREVRFWVASGASSVLNCCVSVSVDTEELTFIRPSSSGEDTERGHTASCSAVIESQGNPVLYIGCPDGMVRQVGGLPNDDGHPIEFVALPLNTQGAEPGLKIKATDIALRHGAYSTPDAGAQLSVSLLRNGREVTPMASVPIDVDGQGDAYEVADGEMVSTPRLAADGSNQGTELAWELRNRGIDIPVGVAAVREQYEIAAPQGVGDGNK